MLGGLAFCGTAQAQATVLGHPMPPYAFDAKAHIQGYLDRAEAFWADRGGYLGCDVRVWWVEFAEDWPPADAHPDACVIQLHPRQWHEIRSPRRRCLIIAHEYGHLLGLEHEAGGIMAQATMYQHPTKRCRFGR